MKLRILSVILLSMQLAGAAISTLVLNPSEVIVVPVASDRLTTISFPGPPAHLEGAYIALEPDPPARFQLAFRPGNPFFSIRALSTNATASLNVVWNKHTYVFEFVPSAQPILALTLVEPRKPELVSVPVTPNPQRLLGMLDTAKAYSLLRTQHPAEVSDIQYSARRERYDFGSYEISLEEIFRFKREDSLVFRVVLHNKSDSLFHYVPQSFRVRVGERTFHAAIADGEGRILPLGRVPFYFAITASPDGTPHSLAIENDFVVLVTVPDPPEASPKPPKDTAIPTFKRP